ncbi:MAG: PAS domain S-box protein [Geobacteraceae bacterium]|nr:PAS domain S-box protein [Geobacteraceae bacterium]
MNLHILAGLIDNAALLLSICLVYDTLVLNRRSDLGSLNRATTGFILGVIGVAVMISTVPWYPGVVFDTRSILLSVSGLFFGLAPTLFAMVVTSAYRIFMGGSGVFMGVSVILASGSIGILWNLKKKKGLAGISLTELYVFGLVVHSAMLALMLLLPGPVISQTLRQIGPAVMIVYPAATALLGMLMASRHRNIRAEKALHENEQRFAYAMDATKDGLWDWDIATNEGYFSPGYYRMLGYEPAEFPMNEESWLELVHPDDRDGAFQKNRDCIENRIGSFETEFRMMTKTGEWKWILGRGTAVSRDGSGRALRMVGTHADITDRKNYEDKIRESESKYRTLFELESDALFLIDAEYGDILEVNETATRLYGYTKEELLNLRNVSLSAEPDQTRLATVDRFTSIPVRFHRKKDGTVFPVEITASHFSWKGRPVHIASIRDITERIRAVEERQSLEIQLFQSQKMEAIGQLAGGVAHDFNNILTVILGYADILISKTSRDNPMYPQLEQILSSTMRAAELTKGLLAFSRKQVLNMKPLDAGEIVMDMKKMLGRLIREDIEFRTEIGDALLVVNADKGQIGQVLINLVTNAVDAMPEGGRLSLGVSLTSIDENFIETHKFAAPGDYACLSISDSGCGMDEETCKKIFEPFFTTKETGKGTGLGLSIVYGIVKQHNGYVTVDSEPGAGTTFRVYLPLVASQSVTGWNNPLADLADVEGTETILLAEDDDIVREMNETAFKSAGYPVILAKDGEDAVRKFAENRDRIDLLVFDVVMPKKDGRKAFDEIRLLRPDIRALFMSGYARDVALKKGVPEDELFFIMKPFKPFDLLRNVREILDSSSRG